MAKINVAVAVGALEIRSWPASAPLRLLCIVLRDRCSGRFHSRSLGLVTVRRGSSIHDGSGLEDRVVGAPYHQLLFPCEDRLILISKKRSSNQLEHFCIASVCQVFPKIFLFAGEVFRTISILYLWVKTMVPPKFLWNKFLCLSSIEI